MKIGSLFAGIGGLELGLERAGVGHTVWQVEKDPYCRQVLERHWPDATRYEDVTEVDWSTVEPVEVICGGFPCQDISLAGRGAGLAGERSSLWWEYLRAVRALRPHYVVVENVAALLHRGMGDVLGALAASGYDTEWDCIPAAAVGAPHRRDRVFILAHAISERPGRPEQVGVTGSEGAPGAGDDGEAQPLADTTDQEWRTGSLNRPAEWAQGDSEPRGCGRWRVEPDVGRVANGVPHRVDRLRALGNAVVPQVAEVVGRRLLDIDAQQRAAA